MSCAKHMYIIRPVGCIWNKSLPHVVCTNYISHKIIFNVLRKKKIK